MKEFEPVPGASEPCGPNHCVNGIADIFQLPANLKYMARQRFEPGPTVWKIFVLALLPIPFNITQYS